ncbi:MAG: hypothetical protein OQK24_10410 [Magnetovibrio sp.]|nr:hypothetical protein [Magnetovibrio sp.]
MNMVSSAPSDEEETAGSALCQEMALTVLDDYTQRLIDMIESSTEGVTVSDIRAFLSNYKTSNVFAANDRFKLHFQHCVDRREREIFDPNRRYPFKRILTRRVSAIFAPEGELHENSQYVSRRVLPGLFVTLEKMVGNEPFDKGHNICMDLIEIFNKTKTGFVWEDLYTNPQAQAALDNLLMDLVPHFANSMRRITWMLNLINSELAPAEQFSFEGPAAADWQLDDAGLIRLLRLLFSNLKAQLKDTEHAAALSERYGTEQTRALLALIRTLDKAEI